MRFRRPRGYIAAQQMASSVPAAGSITRSPRCTSSSRTSSTRRTRLPSRPTKSTKGSASTTSCSSSDRDFLRIPLSQEPTLGIESEFPDLFTPGLDGDELTFSAQTTGLAGVHGKEFSNNVNSKIFGVALVATPVADDRTQDVDLARTYFAVDHQVVKALSHQAFIQWDIVFLP